MAHCGYHAHDHQSDADRCEISRLRASLLARQQDVGRLRTAIKELYEDIFSSPYGHEASANKLYEVAFASSVIGRSEESPE